ncbi:MAG: DJ-1/PfpI family protein [Planctomycetota bacterium]
MRTVLKDIGIVVFNGIERLDLEGPLGVLGWAGKISGDPLNIRLLSKDGLPVHDHLTKRSIVADGDLKTATRFDLLLVPGGDPAQFGSDSVLIDEIRRLGSASSILASVCTGALLVAATGLANGKRMTTHWKFRSHFSQHYPKVTLAPERVVHEGNLWSSAGISAGIDMALRLVAACWNPQIAKQVQGSLEYFPEPPFTKDEVLESVPK